MTGSETDPVLLLAAPSALRSELARNLLEANGIPCLLHGQDRDFAELGETAHLHAARPSLYVPRAALEDAREVLVAAWGSLDPGD